MTRWFAATLAAFLGATPVAASVATDVQAPPPARGGTVALIALDGAIGPAAAEYFDDAAQRAERDGAVAIVLRLDTPGGLAEAMRQIVAGMLAAKIPVLAFVAPGGARAASAGTYILYAAQVAAMAPATHVGAATPVSIGGGTPMPPPIPSPVPGGAPTSSPEQPPQQDQNSDAEAQKVANDAVAYIRSLAQLRGRNADWAEQAVRGAATLTADEALQQHVIDFVAGDVDSLLAQADGHRVQVGGRRVTLHLKGVAVREYVPNARTRFLATITSPTIAYLLLLAGIFGLLLEGTHPGALLPGIVGGICLLIGLYALQLLPVNYAGLALMVLGIGLIVAEALNPSVGALGVGGIVAFTVGSIMLMKSGVPGYAVNLGIIGGIAACAAALLVLLLSLAFRARRARPVIGDESMRSETAELLAPVSAGGESWVRVHGERWRARCATALPAGTRVRIVRRQGLLLWVEPADG